jgi:hypothetical protein
VEVLVVAFASRSFLGRGAALHLIRSQQASERAHFMYPNRLSVPDHCRTSSDLSIMGPLVGPITNGAQYGRTLWPSIELL